VLPPSQQKHRVEMVSPFGDSRQFVEHNVGGQAPAGTENVRIAVSAQGGEMTVDDVQLVMHQDSYTHFKLVLSSRATAFRAEGGQPGRLVVASRAGAVYVLDASGTLLAQGQMDGLPARMVRLSDREVALATAEGQVAAYRVP
jgi:hypothetical protein